MGVFLLLYLVIAIENIASFFTLFSVLGGIAIGLGIIFIIFSGISYDCATSYEKASSYSEHIGPYKRILKRGFIIGIVLIFVGNLGKLLPSQKDMMMIAGGTAAYHVLTSDASKEIGSKVFDNLLEKLDTIAKEETVEEEK